MMGDFFTWQDAPRADYAVIGSPVAHSLSPKMHSAAYAELGLDLKYVAIQVDTTEVAMALQHLDGLGYVGVNVTVPHKEEVLLWADNVEPFARRVRAANTLRLATREAINTDGSGFLDTLSDLGLTKKNRVLVLGAGGSARALLAALSDEGYDTGVWNRTPHRAEMMLSEFNILSRLMETVDVSDYDVIVNATSSGIQGDDLGIDWSKAHPGAVAYDLYYTSELTPFLKSAERFGLKCVDGRALLAAQGARSFEWWLDREAPREAMMKAIR